MLSYLKYDTKTFRYWEKFLKMKIVNFQAPVTPCLPHSWLFHVHYHCKILWTNPCGPAIPACEIRHSKAVEWSKACSQNSLFPWALQLTQQHWQHCQAASREFQHNGNKKPQPIKPNLFWVYLQRRFFTAQREKTTWIAKDWHSAMEFMEKNYQKHSHSWVKDSKKFS